MIHLEITQSPKAGGWHMEEVYLWLADEWLLFYPAVFRWVWFLPLFRTGQFWLPVHSVETDSLCFLIFHSCNSSKKGILEEWGKGIVGLIPPDAVQYFSFVNADSAELLVWRDPLMYKCWNIWWEKMFSCLLFLPAFFTCFQGFIQ